MKHFLGFLFLFSLSDVYSNSKIDRQETLNGVSLLSAKEKDNRTYEARTEKLVPFNLDLVKNAITNFSERCNNQLREMRKFSPKDLECKYSNENVVESFIVKNIFNSERLKEYEEAYLVGRIIYNRGSFGFYELVTIKYGKNVQNQRTSTIKLRMLKDKEVSLYTSPQISHESPFDQGESMFILTEIDSNETHLSYEYKAQTDHWLLNKQVTVPQVFVSMSKSINDLVDSIETESSVQKRELASKDSLNKESLVEDVQ